jgi:hypothetical protein
MSRGIHLTFYGTLIQSMCRKTFYPCETYTVRQEFLLNIRDTYLHSYIRETISVEKNTANLYEMWRYSNYYLFYLIKFNFHRWVSNFDNQNLKWGFRGDWPWLVRLNAKDKIKFKSEQTRADLLKMYSVLW